MLPKLTLLAFTASTLAFLATAEAHKSTAGVVSAPPNLPQAEPRDVPMRDYPNPFNFPTLEPEVQPSVNLQRFLKVHPEIVVVHSSEPGVLTSGTPTVKETGLVQNWEWRNTTFLIVTRVKPATVPPQTSTSSAAKKLIKKSASPSDPLITSTPAITHGYRKAIGNITSTYAPFRNISLHHFSSSLSTTTVSDDPIVVPPQEPATALDKNLPHRVEGPSSSTVDADPTYEVPASAAPTSIPSTLSTVTLRARPRLAMAAAPPAYLTNRPVYPQPYSWNINFPAPRPVPPHPSYPYKTAPWPYTEYYGNTLPTAFPTASKDFSDPAPSLA